MRTSWVAGFAYAITLFAAVETARGQSTSRATTTAARTAAPRQPGRAESFNSRLDYVPSERYEDIRNFVVRARVEGATVFNSPDNQTSYLLVRRTNPSNVEEHSRWDDLIIVQSGTGDVEVGAKTTGARFLAAGEMRGGTITTPSRVSLRAGDVARIPAGVPHAFTPTGTMPWEFLLIKVRRPNKPLKVPPATTPSNN